MSEAATDLSSFNPQAPGRGQEELFRHDGAPHVQQQAEYQGNWQRISE